MQNSILKNILKFQELLSSSILLTNNLKMKRDVESSPSSGKRIPTSSKVKGTDQNSEPKGFPDLREKIKQNRDGRSPKQQVQKRRTDDAEDKGRRKSPKST